MHHLRDATEHSTDLRHRECDRDRPGPHHPTDAEPRARHVIHRLERRLAGRDGVPPHLGLDDRFDDAADEDDPERGIADLRTERGGGDELTGAHD